MVTLQTGSIFFSIQLLFLFSFLVGIILGGITGMVLGVAGFDVLYHDTYYVVGHFHLILSMGGFSIIFAVVYHYWFVFFRTRYNKFFAVLHFLFFFFWGASNFYTGFIFGYVRYAPKNKRLPTSFFWLARAVFSRARLCGYKFIFFFFSSCRV